MATSLNLLLTTALAIFHPVLADLPPYASDPRYQASAYGEYPSQSYITDASIIAPRANIKGLPSNSSTSSDRFVFFTPRGVPVAGTATAPTILEANNNLTLVWSGAQWGAAYPFRVQPYNGSDYLTFWSGVQESLGYGRGNYYMLNSSYDLVYNLTNVNLTVGGDFHEFQLTDNNTALITTYEPVQFNLSALGGPANGWLMDGVFQEIDIATNALIFEWRASSFYSLNDSYILPSQGLTGETSDLAFDFFHINSVEKDDANNYLVSGRHTHSICYIDGSNGQVIWTMGGRKNMFRDLSDGQATNFAWQHDPRWIDTNTISLFDNAATDQIVTQNFTRGLRLTLDQQAMTVSLQQSFLSPDGILSASQGSFQNLDNGNAFMGYGSNPAFTEYSSTGEVLWDAQFGILGNQTVRSSTVQSYRAYKGNWTGTPSWDPTLVTRNGDRNVYMSWNGATEIRTWALMTSSNTTMLNDWQYLSANVTKSGFETSALMSNGTRYVRALAMDSNWALLRASDVLDMRSGDTTRVNGTINLTPPAPPPETTSAAPSATNAAPPSSSSTGAAMPTAMPIGVRWAVMLAPAAVVGMAMG